MPSSMVVIPASIAPSNSLRIAATCSRVICEAGRRSTVTRHRLLPRQRSLCPPSSGGIPISLAGPLRKEDVGDVFQSASERPLGPSLLQRARRGGLRLSHRHRPSATPIRG